MSDLERDIRRLISGYVGGQVPFADFSAALAMRTWDLGAEDPEAHQLAYDIDLLGAEFTSGHRTEDELRSALGTLLGGNIDLEMAGLGRIVTMPHGIVWDSAPTAHHAAWVTKRGRARATNELRHAAVPA